MIKFEKIHADILSNIPTAKDVLLQDANVVFAYLFGGLARGKAMPLSDVDIAVYLNSMEDLPQYKLDLFDRLTDALGTCEVDLVILNKAPISLVGRILANKQVLADKEPYRRHIYESLSLREFFDFRVKEDNLFSSRYNLGR
ncbi:MAG: nucleotidyltransferase domain-containing protein [Deltaproteobacteria bacterium]|nr:nucleotidyltransferase domain-containing protein [Deltaproteobacteria bacterium]